MPVYVVSYDIKQGQGPHDYDDLYAAFDKLKSHRVLLSVFLVYTSWTAKQLSDHLYSHMDSKDRIWVSRMPPKVNQDHAYRAMPGTNAWLKKYPPS